MKKFTSADAVQIYGNFIYISLCLEVKPLIENMSPRFYLAGDSGYPISKTLITPYSTEEAESKN